MTDAIVVGSGPNGLVAANVLADAGWDVGVVEASDEPGGGVRSGRYVHPEFVSDFCSAFYPFVTVSPAIAALDLDRYGLRWSHAEHVLAHPLPDGRCAVLARTLDETCARLDELSPGDGAAWRRLHEMWRDVHQPLLDAMFAPFPPVGAGLRLAARLRASGLLRFARFGLLPVRRLLEEEFTGPGGLLIAGNSLHTDLSPEAAGSALFGWLLAMVGQDNGYPVPEGGAAALTDALVRRLRARGGWVRCGSAATEIVVRSGRAVAVRTADGEEHPAGKAVLAAINAPFVFGGLVGWDDLPARFRDDMRRFQWDFATMKVDWALDGKVPWLAAEAQRAGTVHLASSLDEMTEYTAHLAMGRVPAHPFLLIGQLTTADPTRSPAGTESLWAYSHVPQQVRGDAGDARLTGQWDDAEAAVMADRIEARIEQFAPGFRDRIIARSVHSPPAMQEHNPNLMRGALNGGTTALHQELVFRPAPGLARTETPVRGLYLASASAHPGGGVHGVPGANAARAALAEQRAGRRLVAAPTVTLVQRLVRGGTAPAASLARAGRDGDG